MNDEYLSLKDKFPIKEKLSTDLDTQIAWMLREMGYSRDKSRAMKKNLSDLDVHRRMPGQYLAS